MTDTCKESNSYAFYYSKSWREGISDTEVSEFTHNPNFTLFLLLVCMGFT